MTAAAPLTTIPDCDNVTVDEYVACTLGTIELGVAYLSTITLRHRSGEPRGTRHRRGL